MDEVHLGLKTEELNQLIAWIDKKFLEHGADHTLHGTDDAKIAELVAQVQQAGAVLVPCKQRHVGTDKARDLIIGMREELKKLGVEFLLQTRVDAIETHDRFICHTTAGQITAQNIILAPGRGGSHWLREQADILGIEHHWGRIDIGVRIEMPQAAYPLTKTIYDPKIRIPLKNGDYVKTFCTNQGGKVRLEMDGDSLEFEGRKLRLINGDALNGVKFPNTNFAVLYKLGLTEPLADTKAFGREVITHTYRLGNWKPLIQRMGDFMQGRRSKWETFFDREKGFNIVRPSLPIGIQKQGGVVTPGDIRLALPGRIVDGLQQAFEVLDQIAGKHQVSVEVLDTHGNPTGTFKEETVHILHPSTLIYAPEVKFGDTVYANYGNLETNIPGIYIAGNANNTSGIIAGWISGIIAARGIASKEKRRIADFRTIRKQEIEGLYKAAIQTTLEEQIAEKKDSEKIATVAKLKTI